MVTIVRTAGDIGRWFQVRLEKTEVNRVLLQMSPNVGRRLAVWVGLVLEMGRSPRLQLLRQNMGASFLCEVDECRSKFLCLIINAQTIQLS